MVIVTVGRGGLHQAPPTQLAKKKQLETSAGEHDLEVLKSRDAKRGNKSGIFIGEG